MKIPAPVPTWHNDTYPDIDPKRPELSHAGETVIITGAGRGIGRHVALSFAASGANLILIGRTESTLLETKALLPETTKCSIYPCDVSDASGMARIAQDVGTWDVFVQNAAMNAPLGSLAEIDLADIDRVWDVNVRSLYITAKAFLPNANKDFASLLVVTSNAAHFPDMFGKITPYMDSKVAQVKVAETLAAQYPGVSVVTFHPGGIVTDGFLQAGIEPDSVPTDQPALPGDFAVWASKPEQKIFSGRYLWANWDVNELIAMQEEMVEKGLFKINVMQGWPFQ